MKKLFENVGKKLQLVAKIYLWVGIVVSVVVGATFFVDIDEGFFTFLLIGLVGSGVSIVSSLFIYAFGQLVENVAAIKEKRE